MIVFFFLITHISFFKSRVREPGLPVFRLPNSPLLRHCIRPSSLTRLHPPMTPLSEKSWRKIPQARDLLDWEALRLQSLAPGGFGPARAYIWYVYISPSDLPPSSFLNLLSRPRLLHVHMSTLEIPEGQNEPDSEPHRDERQIRLDTDRSFVLYPVGDAPPYLIPPPLSFTWNPTDDAPDDDRVTRQAELNKLIVQLFRRHPGLNYFQVNFSGILCAHFGIYMRI